MGGKKIMSILNIDDFIEKMKNKEVSTSPFEDIRNEAAQKKNYGRRIPFFKKEKETNYKLLPLKSIAFPFDPFLVEATDDYNETTKFRTEVSAETMMKAFKKYYNDNTEAKEKFMKKAKVTSWNTEQFDELTKEDIKVFAPFTVPYVFTLPLIHVNNKVVTGNPNGADYKIDIKRDEVGRIKEEWVDKEGEKHKTPKFVMNAMELASFFSSMALNQYNEWVRGEGANKTDDDKFKYKMSLMSASPISEDRPRNYLLAYAIDMGKNLTLEDTIKEMEPKDFAKHLVLVSYTSNVRTTVEGFKGTYASRDVYPGFYEIDVIVPDIEDKKERGQKTKWNNAEVKLSEYEDKAVLDTIRRGTSEYLDSIKDIDKIFLGSSYVNPYDAETHEALLRNLSETVDPSKLELTEKIVTRFGGLISDIWGSAAKNVLLAYGMGELKEGTEVTDKELNDARLEMSSVMADLNSDDGMDEIEIVEE